MLKPGNHGREWRPHLARLGLVCLPFARAGDDALRGLGGIVRRVHPGLRGPFVAVQAVWRGCALIGSV